MSPLLASQTDPSSPDSTPSAASAPGDASVSGPDSAQSPRRRAAGPKAGPTKSSRKQKPPDESTPKLVLDPKAVADVDGLEEEVAILRASIRQLANGGDELAPHVKVLAEVRHQIEALCRALKTQQSLQGPDGDGRAAEMRRILEELGDQLGVER